MELDDISKFVLDKVEAAKIVLEKEILLGHEFDDFGHTSVDVYPFRSQLATETNSALARIELES